DGSHVTGEVADLADEVPAGVGAAQVGDGGGIERTGGGLVGAVAVRCGLGELDRVPGDRQDQRSGGHVGEDLLLGAAAAVGWRLVAAAVAAADSGGEGDRVEFGSRRVEAREGGAALLGEGGRGRAEAQRGAAEGGLAAAE